VFDLQGKLLVSVGLMGMEFWDLWSLFGVGGGGEGRTIVVIAGYTPTLMRS
jgi:hypothetical protein